MTICYRKPLLIDNRPLNSSALRSRAMLNPSWAVTHHPLPLLEDYYLCSKIITSTWKSINCHRSSITSARRSINRHRSSITSARTALLPLFITSARRSLHQSFITSHEPSTVTHDLPRESICYRWMSISYRWMSISYRWMSISYRWISISYRWMTISNRWMSISYSWMSISYR